MNASLHTGFSAPVFDSQSAFRAIMNAMARPGSVQTISLALTPPTGLPLAAAASILALCDFETSIWVDPQIESAAEITDYCVFQTGCTRATSPQSAQFAIVKLQGAALNLDQYHQGTAEYPDRSTTVIAIVTELSGGQNYSLSGPGINGTTPFNVQGLQADFATQWAQNRAVFPLGIDMVFCAGTSLLA
ncbi:MAG: phosphonate C-P lyase system protein PhnH, partial [Notoacmeibacter sp.]